MRDERLDKVKIQEMQVEVQNGTWYETVEFDGDYATRPSSEHTET